MNKNGFRISPRLNGVKEYYFSKKLREIAQLEFKGRSIINLGIGSPDMAPPESVIQCLADTARENGSHKYQSYKGIPQLRIAFAEWYHKYFQVTLDPEHEILPLIGSKEGIMHISMSFIHEGDLVLVPNPGYPTYKAASTLAGGNPVAYDLCKEGGWIPDIQKLEEEVDLDKVSLMWINYPHMPTGTKATGSQLTELVKFARKHDIILVNDNPYSFILNDEPLSVLKFANENDLVLELNSLSKSHNMAGWRVGVAAGNKTLIEHILRFKSNMDSGMFLPIMKASIKALYEDDSWYLKLNENYEERRSYAWQLLDLLDCRYDKTQSGMFVWAEIPSDWSNGEEFADWILAQTGIFITPGFIFGDQGDKYVRISLCNDIPIWEEVINEVKQNIVIKN